MTTVWHIKLSVITFPDSWF